MPAQHVFFFRFFVAALTAVVVTSFTSARADPEHPLIPSLPFSKVANSRAVGLDFERPAAGESAGLTEQARTFIQFRHGMPAKKKLQWVAECLAHPVQSAARSVFCDFIVERKPGHRFPVEITEDVTSLTALLSAGRAAGRIKSEEDRASPKVSEALLNADFGRLADVKTPQIQKALRAFPSWEPLKRVTEAALSSRDCPPAPLLTALGQKAEEYFPDQRFRNTAIALYSRANECQSGDTADKARFRLSLLHIWQGECRKADPLLLRLSDQKGGDFSSRALFWRAYCARASGDKLLSNLLRGRLLKDFPLSYHALVTGRGKQVENSWILTAQEPAALFRSSKHPELNPVLRAIERLQQLHAEDLADELLDTIAERIEGAEPGVRLYAAALMGRFGDRIAQFKMLSATFQDEPSTISRATLSSFYPLKRFETLRLQGNRVDPYFVAAVIRQESGFSERARSPVGAVGLMQLMPATARRMERVSRRELMDAKTNIRLGVKYLQKLLGRYSFDGELALAAYNAGPEKVDEWRRRYRTENRMLFLDLIPFKETRDYVALIGRNYYWYLSLYGGLQPEDGRSPASASHATVRTTKTPMLTVFSF